MPEPPSATRSAFRRDCDRIIHSAAFRRLAHKTQVFVFHEGDHFRTRLTHTLEVTQIARSLARALGLDEDLAEASALGHDLGHPPFGHAGERALDQCLAAFGGFDHNAQTLHVVTALERRYADFDGLNLTWETLEGLVKHNGPLTDRAGHPVARYARARPAARHRRLFARRTISSSGAIPAPRRSAAPSPTTSPTTPTTSTMGLRAEMFRIEELASLPLLDDILREIAAQHPRLEPGRHAHELIRRLITRMIEDVIAQSRPPHRRARAGLGRRGAQRRPADRRLLARRWREADRAIKDFLYPRLYRHARIMRIMDEAEEVVRRLFAHYVDDAGRPAGRLAGGLDAGRCRRPRAADRRFHRRHDRPLRHGGAHADFRRDAGVALGATRYALLASLRRCGSNSGMSCASGSGRLNR